MVFMQISRLRFKQSRIALLRFGVVLKLKLKIVRRTPNSCPPTWGGDQLSGGVP